MTSFSSITAGLWEPFEDGSQLLVIECPRCNLRLAEYQWGTSAMKGTDGSDLAVGQNFKCRGCDLTLQVTQVPSVLPLHRDPRDPFAPTDR